MKMCCSAAHCHANGGCVLSDCDFGPGRLSAKDVFLTTGDSDLWRVVWSNLYLARRRIGRTDGGGEAGVVHDAAAIAVEVQHRRRTRSLSRPACETFFLKEKTKQFSDD